MRCFCSSAASYLLLLFLLLLLHCGLSISEPNPDHGYFQWYDEMDPNYPQNETPQTLVLRVTWPERARFGTRQPWLNGYVCMVLDGNDWKAPAEPRCIKIGYWEKVTDGEVTGGLEPWIDWKVSYYDLPKGRDKLYFLGVNNSEGLNLLQNPSRHFAIAEEDGSWPVDTSSASAQTLTAMLSPSTMSGEDITTSISSPATSSPSRTSTVTTTSISSPITSGPSTLTKTSNSPPSFATPTQGKTTQAPQSSGWRTAQFGAVFGGIVGGLVVMAAFAICIHQARRDSRMKKAAINDDGTNHEPSPEIAGKPNLRSRSGSRETPRASRERHL
ncbi:hypothetical protein V8F33_012707 [Rhypophila sp. PSN 637]